MGKKILTVLTEDIVKQELTKNGYTVIEALEGYRAMSLALSDKPDMVIIDVRIPAGGGFMLYKNMRKSSFTATIPVIFIATSVSEILAGNIQKDGTVDFLAKPFTAADLMRKVRRMFPKPPPPAGTNVIDITI